MSCSKRNRNRVSYFEPEEPSFDDYVFCTDCGDYVYEYCSIHGPLLVIPDEQIFDHNRKPIHTLDARDPNRSNWMRYVNCSRHYSEQNLLAFQYKGKLYYRTIKIIPRFTELLVFYGSEFANELNIDLRRYHSSTFEKPLAKREPENEQNTQPEIKMAKCFPTLKPETETGPEDVQDTQIPEMKLNNGEPDDEQGTQTPENSDKCSSTVKYELKDVEQNTPIPLQRVKGFSFINKSDDERESTSQETQIDTDTVVDAKDYILQNESMELAQNIHYESKLYTVANISKEPKKDIIESNDFEIDYKINCGQSDQKSFNDSEMQDVATNFNKLKKYSCPICEAGFVTKSEFINHDIKVHDSKNNYKACTICDYKTVRNSSLNIHLQTHSDEKYKCDICGYETQYLLYLERHKNTHICKYCQRIFRTKHQLYKHLSLHKEDQTYEDEGITHFKTHTESAHTCTVCGKEFGKAYSLKRHMETHNQLRAYICGICKSGYKHMNSFKHHMKVHVNENQ